MINEIKKKLEKVVVEIRSLDRNADVKKLKKKLLKLGKDVANF